MMFVIRLCLFIKALQICRSVFGGYGGLARGAVKPTAIVAFEVVMLGSNVGTYGYL